MDQDVNGKVKNLSSDFKEINLISAVHVELISLYGLRAFPGG